MTPEKAGQAVAEPVDEAQHNLRLGLDSAFGEIDRKLGKVASVVGFRLRATLKDREPLFRVRFVDLGDKLVDALFPVALPLVQIEISDRPMPAETRIRNPPAFCRS